MSSPEKDLYFVAVKLFMRDGDKILIIHDIFGAWDLPGGRIRKEEFATPLTAVIERKVREELGPEIGYELGDPNNTFFRVERAEHGLGDQKVRIFAVGYDAAYEGGDIQLGDYIDQLKWVDLSTFQPEEYFTGGWLEGVQDYLAKTRKQL